MTTADVDQASSRLSIGAAVLLVAIGVVAGAVVLGLRNSARRAAEIHEEAAEVSLLTSMQAAFDAETERVDRLVQVLHAESGDVHGSPGGEATGDSGDGTSVHADRHASLMDHGIGTRASFQAAVSQMEPTAVDEKDVLNRVVRAYDAYLAAVDELHDRTHAGEDILAVSSSTLAAAEAAVRDAMLELRELQNAEISEASAAMERMTVLLRREVPALLVLSLLIWFTWYRVVAKHRRQVEYLQRLNREKSEFIASVSHELRTPLTGVTGFAQLLRDGGTELSEAERADMLGLIAEEGYEVAGIMENLLVVARADIGDLVVTSVPVDLRAQAAQVLESWQPPLEKPIELTGDTARALGDPARIRQILRNLLINAAQYGGDEIHVDVGNSSPSTVWVTVRDNGAGIPPEDRERIFQAYERAHEAPGLVGTMGLGLTVSSQLARLMNGDLTYHYEEGQSIFKLSLPAAPQDS